MDEALTVLFEDAHCLATVKRGGELTQPTAGDEESLEARVRRYLDPRDPASVYLGTVHRLDRPVSGVVLWAKTVKAARRLAAQFAARQASKEYWAVVEGTSDRLMKPEGRWEDWLTNPDRAGVARSVGSSEAGTRLAVTRFQQGKAVLLPANTLWLRLWPETGRTHQLRAQTAHHGLTILGDAAYGSVRSFPQGIALHARTLRVDHPILGVALELTAPLPASWNEQGIALPTAG